MAARQPGGVAWPRGSRRGRGVRHLPRNVRTMAERPPRPIVPSTRLRSTLPTPATTPSHPLLVLLIFF